MQRLFWLASTRVGRTRQARCVQSFFILTIVVVCFGGTVAAATPQQGISTQVQSEVDHAKDRFFLAPKKAKTFLRVRRGWGGWTKKITGEEEEEEEESGREHRHRVYLARTCPRTCLGAWSHWSRCTATCGHAGTRTRRRSVSPPSQCAGWVRAHGCSGERSQTIHCNRHCYNGGRKSGTGCSCGTGYTGTCCQTRITCPYPGKPSHGEVTPSSSRLPYGSKVTFTCHTGYRLSGSSTRQCQQNGQWNNAVPRCNIVSCGDPGVSSHGRKQGSTFTYGHNVVYSCVEGYILHGNNTLKCQANARWLPSRPTCARVRCPTIHKPSSGSVRLSDSFFFRSVAQFSCSSGFYLEGSSRRTCQLSAAWDGTQTACKRITCSRLNKPSNGAVSYRNADVIVHGDKASFSCHMGYVLRGPQSRTCTGTSRVGVWTGDVTSCQAVSCGDPGTPAHGSKLGGAYTFPFSVEFRCLPGYFMVGGSKTTCGSNARWSIAKPVCRACPVNTYQVSSTVESGCTDCPAHSHTVSTASARPTQCVCDAGYSGPPGGPCGQVRCERLQAVAHSSLSACQNTAGDKCVFTCQRGYIRSTGSRERVCQNDGSWSGTSPTCSACPINTHQATSTKCEACPSNSHTSSAASVLTGCVCNAGYQGPPGGPCTDVDECASSDRGGCQQACVNNQGSFTCACNIPGYSVDPDNRKRCKATRACSALSAPDNGGLVCASEASTNTRRCEVKCNKGFEHIDRTNTFEECGPSSNWLWTNEVNDTPLLPCIEQFFAGVEVDAEVAYFVTSCSLLNNAQKEVLRQKFAQMLQAQGICQASNQNSCTIDDFDIKCGVEDTGFGFRRKRSIGPTRPKLRIRFHIRVRKQSVRLNQCVKGCAANGAQCEAACATQFTRKATQAVVVAKTKLQRIFNESMTTTTTRAVTPQRRVPITPYRRNGGFSVHRRISGHWINRGIIRPRPTSITPVNPLSLMIGGMRLMPAGSSASDDVTVKCEQGMAIKNGMCVACPQGTYLPSENATCMACGPGTYQPQSQQVRCLACNARNRSNQSGATSCG